VALNQKTRSMVWPCLAHSTPSDTCHDFSRVFKMGWDSYIGDSRNWDTLDHFCCVMNITPNDLDANLGSSHSLGSLRWSWLHKPQQNPTTFPLNPHYIPIKSHFYLVESPFLLVHVCCLAFRKHHPAPELVVTNSRNLDKIKLITSSNQPLYP
jgi:hypothetical protein